MSYSTRQPGIRPTVARNVPNFEVRQWQQEEAEEQQYWEALAQRWFGDY